MGAETTYPLRALSGRRAAHVLAVWGLVDLLPGARLSFTDQDVPVLWWDGADLAGTAAAGLVERTWDLDHGPLRGVSTTTPARSVVNPLTEQAWEQVPATGLYGHRDPLAVFDVSRAAKRPGTVADLQVGASTLTLLSGRSHAPGTVRATWTCLRAKDEQTAYRKARRSLEHLRYGVLDVALAKPGLRFSATLARPRGVSGSERCAVHPLIDLLAWVGQTLLLPRQRSVPAPRRPGVSALSWVLNPVPLPLDVLLDLHESPPAGLPWPRWTARVQTLGGSTRVTALGTAHPDTPGGPGGPVLPSRWRPPSHTSLNKETL